MIANRSAPLFAALWLFAAPAAMAEPAQPDWSQGLRAGTDGSGLSLEAARARIAEADILLLGEMHDNPSHHAGQALAMAWRFDTAPKGRRPSVVFEMLNRGQRDALAAYDGGPGNFGAAMAWTERGWPDPAIYAPVFETAFGAGARLAAADLKRETIGALFERGEDAMPAPIRRAYDLLSPLPEAMREAMTEIQFQSHCELMPRERMDGMVLVQRARDAALAEAVIDTFERYGPPVILIAGNGHVRQDHGTGRLLRDALPDARVVTVGFREAPLEPSPEPYDIVWLTDRPERGDPCESLRERFGGN
jgi:uncharacterized iron-regulated protein